MEELLEKGDCWVFGREEIVFGRVSWVGVWKYGVLEGGGVVFWLEVLKIWLIEIDI